MSASQFADRRIIYGASARLRSINLEKRFADLTAAAVKADICARPLATPTRDRDGIGLDWIGLDWRRLQGHLVNLSTKGRGINYDFNCECPQKLNGNVPLPLPSLPLASSLPCIFAYSYSPFPFECTLKTFVVVVTFGPLMLSCL